MVRAHGALIMIASVVLAVAGASGCRVNRPPNDHAVTQTLYDSMGTDPGTFNPILVTDSASGQAVGDLFEGLVRMNPITTLPEPGLAQSWELSDGDKTITFHLRRDVKWSDGVPLTSRDVVFTMRAIYDPRVPNSESFSLTVDGKPIKVEAPDKYTVVMRMPRAFAPLLYSIGFPIVPAHALEHGLDSGQFNRTWGIDTPPQKLISLGPYRMERYVPGQLIKFTRNPDYWMRDEHGGELPRLHGQVLLIVPDPNAQYLRFMDGQTDVYNPRPEEVFSLRENAAKLNITIKSVGVDTGSLFFAFNRNPRHFIQKGVVNPKYKWFTDINFMRALAHAVDKQGMINLCFRGLGVPAVSDVSPANKIFYDPNLKPYARLQPYDQHRRGDPRRNVRNLQARPRETRHPGKLSTAGIHHAGQGARLEFRLGLRTDRFHGRNRAEQRRQLPALVGQPAYMEPEPNQAGDAVGSRD